MKAQSVNGMNIISREFSYECYCLLQIDFSISVEESGIVAECSGTEAGVARGTEARTILDNLTTRNMFIDDLYEVCSW
jgi:hypothetical protein